MIVLNKLLKIDEFKVQLNLFLNVWELETFDEDSI